MPRMRGTEEAGFRIDHMFEYTDDRTFGSWSCTKCGVEIRGKYHHATNSITIDIVPGTRSKPGIMLVKLNPKPNEPVYFVFNQTMYSFFNDDPEKFRYSLEEHSCPCNFTRFPVIAGNDVDPHGIFKFIQIVERPDEWGFSGLDDATFRDYAALFPALREEDEP